MGSHVAAVCCDSQFDSICPSPGANPQLCNWQKPPPYHYRTFSMLYNWCDTKGCRSFIYFFLHIDPPIWPKDFKGLYSTAVLSSLCVPWPTRAFWYCFASLTVVCWQQYCHIGQFHRVFSLWMLTYFSWLWFSCAVIFGAVHLQSHKLVTLMKFSSALVVTFGLISTTFGLVLSHFLMFSKNIIHCSSCSVLIKKNQFSKNIWLH